MKLCLNRATAGAGLSLPDFVNLAATAGFPGADVDLSYGVEHGAAALRDLYAARNVAFGGWGLRFDWRTDTASTTALSKQAAIAAELKIDACATHILPSSDLPLHQNWHFHVQRLSVLAQVLADHGLRFGLEFVSPYPLRRKWKHEFVFTPMAMMELAADVGPNCGLLIDTYHLHAAGEPMSVVAQFPREKIVLVHINDCPPVPLDKIEDKNRLLPGQGVIDLKSFYAALKSTAYTGPVSVEVFSDALKALPPQEAARQAWSATQAAMAAM
jgi:sugar phosphate isomerase/epimerase